MQKKKIVLIIQARTGSKRLPKKMLFEINGLKIIEWVLLRCKLVKNAEIKVLATSIKPNDEVLCKIADKCSLKYFCGSENDLLNRYYECAKKYSAEIVIRVCADNPLVSYELIDWTIDYHIKSNAEYTFSGSNKITKWADGFGCEICNFDLLEKLEHLNISANDREHVFEYIWNNQNKYNINYFCASKDYQFPDIKLDIDYKSDYDFMKKFIENKNININSNMKDIIQKYIEFINLL
jgi:spore coat polysaccharide biosynthesis protein SpsF